MSISRAKGLNYSRLTRTAAVWINWWAGESFTDRWWSFELPRLTDLISIVNVLLETETEGTQIRLWRRNVDIWP